MDCEYILCFKHRSTRLLDKGRLKYFIVDYLDLIQI